MRNVACGIVAWILCVVVILWHCTFRYISKTIFNTIMLCLNNHHSIASMCRSIRIYAISSSSSCIRQCNATQCNEQTKHRWQNLIITFWNICLYYKSQKLTDFITNDDHLFTLDLDILSFSGHKIRRSKSDHLFESNQGGVELCSWLNAGKFPWFNQS